MLYHPSTVAPTVTPYSWPQAAQPAWTYPHMTSSAAPFMPLQMSTSPPQMGGSPCMLVYVTNPAAMAVPQPTMLSAAQQPYVMVQPDGSMILTGPTVPIATTANGMPPMPPPPPSHTSPALLPEPVATAASFKSLPPASAKTKDEETLSVHSHGSTSSETDDKAEKTCLSLETSSPSIAIDIGVRDGSNVPQEPTVLSPSACDALIKNLRQEKTDRGVRARVLRLPGSSCTSLIHFFDKYPQMITDLCVQDRGIIVAHLVERLGGEGCGGILMHVERNFISLSLNQSGCIAVPRILSGLPEGRDLQKFFDLMMRNVDVLVTHPFGNYIVKHFVSLKNEIYNRRFLTEFVLQRIDVLGVNKFGSHVLEELLRSCTHADLYPLASRVFSDALLLKSLCFDRFGNYCVQTMFQVLSKSESSFLSWCISQAAFAARGSPFEQNILKSAAIHGGHRAQ